MFKRLFHYALATGCRPWLAHLRLVSLAQARL
jgi:hypothetical protein